MPILNKLSSMFMSEDGKNWSSQRVIAVTISIIWTLIIGIMWIVTSIHTKALVALDPSIVQLYLGALGIVWASKIATTILAESKVSSDGKNDKGSTEIKTLKE